MTVDPATGRHADMRPDPGMNRAAAARGPYPHDAPEIPEIKEIVA